MTDFALDPRIEADTLPIAHLMLCELRLMKDRRWPWTMLVPRRAGAVEIFDLTQADRALLIEETAQVGRALKTLTGAAKINVGALGNIVSQLHVHVLARTEADPAWPGQVWGFGTAEPYRDGDAEAFAERIAKGMERP